MFTGQLYHSQDNDLFKSCPETTIAFPKPKRNTKYKKHKTPQTHAQKVRPTKQSNNSSLSNLKFRKPSHLLDLKFLVIGRILTIILPSSPSSSPYSQFHCSALVLLDYHISCCWYDAAANGGTCASIQRHPDRYLTYLSAARFHHPTTFPTIIQPACSSTGYSLRIMGHLHTYVP
jgi:hypothetical protein